MLLKMALCSLTINIAFSACSGYCETCLDQNSIIGRMTCTSCHDQNFLYQSQCLDCDQCDTYGACDQCQKRQAKNTNQDRSIIIFTTIICAVFLSGLGIVLYCKYCTYPVSNEQVERNASQVTMLELVLPENLEWSRGDKAISDSQSCAICLQINVSSQTKCHHLYHANCIWQWSRKREQVCPLCKSKAISPVKYFCSKCSINFIEINVSVMSKIMEDSKWKTCSYCKLLSSDLYS